MADVAVPSVATGTPGSSDTVLGVQSGVVKRFPASPPFAQLAATTGAGLVGYSSGEVYAAGTVGAAIEAAAASGATNLSYTASPTNGVVASDTGTDATLSLATGTNAGLLAPADFTKLSNTSGTNTGDETGARVATLLHAATAKTTLVDADEVSGTDSASSFSLIRTTWANAWVYIKSKADAIYQATLVSGTNIKTINGASVLGSGDLTVTGSGGGTGDVVGPASSVNNHVAFFSGTTGKLIADSGLTLSGSNTGDQTTVSGNAGTATALQTARTINGTSFDGTANITVTAAAGTLTGATLASGVTASSLTSFGAGMALGTPASGVATNLTGTAAGLTAGTVTTNANLTGDVTSSGNATTLATVNSNVGSFTNASITVNAKGLITAASTGTGGSSGLSFDLNGGTASSTTWDFTLNCGASA